MKPPGIGPQVLVLLSIFSRVPIGVAIFDTQTEGCNGVTGVPWLSLWSRSTGDIILTVSGAYQGQKLVAEPATERG